MKSMILVALALVAVAAAAPAEEPIPILSSNFDQQPDGPYQFGYKSADGSERQEEGQLKEALDEDNKPHTVVVVRGTYSYPSEDGTPISINYYADETGYHAEGESVPKVASR